jgi:hypothetical protein
MEILWGLVIVGGPLLLLGALIFAKVQSGRRAKDIDPGTPSDDPSRGMPGHDRPR